MTYRDAVREALREALLARRAGLSHGRGRRPLRRLLTPCAKGLIEEFGEERIRDTPLSESGFVGAGIGAALGGMRPIVEIMTVNFSLLALDQIVNTAATLLHMSGGQFSVPLVIRMATGAGRQLAAQHSHSLEGWYAHVPGIKVAGARPPSRTRAACSATALADPDPVIIFEHQTLYNVEGELPQTPARSTSTRAASCGAAARDLTLVTYGGSLHKSLAAADELAEDGIECEVDRPAQRCVRSTMPPSWLAWPGRIAWSSSTRAGASAGLSAEISARIMEQAFYDLDGPSRACAPPRCRSPTRATSKQAALPQRGQPSWRRRGGW